MDLLLGQTIHNLKDSMRGKDDVSKREVTLSGTD